MIYFDNAATSFYKPKEVKNSVINAMDRLTANPGRSGHNLSQNVAVEVFETRENIKDFLGAKDYELIFTKNCTEALNLAILGTLKKGDNVIITCYEHNSVLRPLEYLKSVGVEVTILDCDLKDFHCNLLHNIKDNTKLVITTMVSNVTGDICDVERVAKTCKQHKIKYLIDGAQACGHMVIDLNNIGADMFAFAGHKGLLSITGVGGLLIKDLENLKPINYGGTGTDSINLTQPTESLEGFESGTIPTIPIISLNAGVKFLKKNFEKIIEKEQKLSKYLVKSLKNLKFLTVYSTEETKNVVSFNVGKIDSMLLANILNEQFGICVRSGLHCAPLVHKKLNTTEQGAVRISIDFYNTFEEIDCLVNALKKLSS